MGPDSALLALIPIRDDEGEVAGWLHLEWEHHLAPGLATLTHLARSWRARVLGLRLARSPRAAAISLSEPSLLSKPGSLSDPGVRRPLCAEVFHELVEAVGIKTSQRRWWGFSVEGERLIEVAQGGEGLSRKPREPGLGRALGRSLSSGGTVLFEEPDRRLSLHGEAASGLVVPLRDGARVFGLWALESVRQRDFRSVDRERYESLAAHFALALHAAQFRGWHRTRFGFDLSFPVERSDFRRFARRLFSAGASGSPLVLCGPLGSGKSVLARWLHYAAGVEGEGGVLKGDAIEGDAFEIVEASSLDESELGPGSGPAGTLVVKAVEDLAPPAQARLLQLLEGTAFEGTGLESTGFESTGPEGSGLGEWGGANWSGRLLFTTRSGLAPAVEDGRLRADLAQRLDRLQFFVPALCDRREEIPTLVDFFVRRFAACEELRPPELADEARALLWRQRWDGNLRELEGFVFKLVLFHAGSSVGQSQLHELAADFRISLEKRLPSRHPRRADLLAALWTTRKRAGAVNKVRASAYLGWDPDTLVARMSDLGLSAESLSEPRSWSLGPGS